MKIKKIKKVLEIIIFLSALVFISIIGGVETGGKIIKCLWCVPLLLVGVGCYYLYDNI